MVTRGCRTCVQRRVKCDAARPICERCAKGNRTCIWNPNEQGGLRFLDESSFAQGKARRPRVSKVASPSATATVTTLAPSPRPPPTLSLDDHAFQYWAQTNVTQAGTLHEAAHEWHTHVIPYWIKAKPGSCLYLAVSTLSRAVFGRARGVPQALAQADRSYAQCLYKTQQAVGGQSHENMDELLLTTMMMGYFENIRYNINTSETSVRETDAVGTRYTNVFCHYEGAMGLLRIRRECGVDTDATLDKVARRQIVSVSITPPRTINADSHRYVLRSFAETPYLTGCRTARSSVRQAQRYSSTLSWSGSLPFVQEHLLSFHRHLLDYLQARLTLIIWLIPANISRMISFIGLSLCQKRGRAARRCCQKSPKAIAITMHAEAIAMHILLTVTPHCGSASERSDS